MAEQEPKRDGLTLVADANLGQADARGRKGRKRRALRLKKDKPLKVLPTDRINFGKQLDILRAYAVASGPSGRAVTNKEVAAIVKMVETTVSLSNAFFTDVGLLARNDGGLVPCPEVFSFQRAHEWNPEGAGQKLAPVISNSWFALALTPRIDFGPLEEEEAVTTLAEAASAPPEYKTQLRILIDYMQAAGLLQRDGSKIKSTRGDQIMTSHGEKTASAATEYGREGHPKAAISTTFTQPTEGTVQFHVSVRVDMNEFADWSPERIAAFFGGIAQVLAAKAAIEKGASSD